MSILDDAIREHLELKRAHGADESELKKLEDEAFGPAERPDQPAEQVDPFAEAPTEFLAAPGDASGATPAEPASGARQLPNIADLQEPPPPKPVEPEENAEDAAAEGPSEEEHPAMEHRIAQPAPEDLPAAPSDELQPDPEAPRAEERHPAADQPTELFDVEGQFEDAAEPASPSDEELLDAERTEPRLGPVDPLADLESSDEELAVSGPADEEPEDEFDEFFSEQRLSDELNQALEAPLPDEPGALEEAEDSGEYELPEESGEHGLPDEPSDEADATEEHKAEPGHADALEDTPEFLEESPEDDDAWFEQRPPKDFDFGD
jgi:hypothetical protein